MTSKPAMMRPRWSWPMAAGFVLSVAAAFSYPLVFVRWPVTRDVPWANLILFAVAAWLIVRGLRQAFAPARFRWARASAATLIAALSAAVFASFVWGVIIVPGRLPASARAPVVGQRAPEFLLVSSDGGRVSLHDLLEPTGARHPKGVLLIFYRGYW